MDLRRLQRRAPRVIPVAPPLERTQCRSPARMAKPLPWRGLSRFSQLKLDVCAGRNWRRRELAAALDGVTDPERLGRVGD